MKTLFDKTNIGNMKLKNRLIRSADGDKFAVNGHMTEEDLQVYEGLAKGGVGTIITGMTYITESDNSLSGTLGIYADSFILEYKKFTDMIHGYNANVVIQLAYYGSHIIGAPNGKKILAPSAVEYMGTNIMPQEISKEEIRNIQKAFVDAAVRAKKAGFDGIQLHSAHGFLLNQFLTPYYNRRSDEHGGTIENRMRMLLETYNLIREAVGSEFSIWVKISCIDGIEQGITFEDFKYVCKQLADSGVNAIEVSGAWYNYKAKDKFYFKQYAEEAAAENKAPIILVGGNKNYDSMTDLLNKTSIKYFSMCRPLIAEPDLVKRWESGDTSKAKCVSCNVCLTSIRLGHEGRCILHQY